MSDEVDLEEISLISLVNYYHSELTRILKGERVTRVIPKAVRRRNLRRNGVLLKGGAVTEEAKRVLGIE